MAFLYDKSRSESFQKYFSQDTVFDKRFNEFDIEEERFRKVAKEFVFAESNKGGIPLSWKKDENSVMVDQTDSHTLVIGPTGAKKTRLIAMPTVRILGAAGESLIISDPKAEVYARTAVYLEKKGYEIKVINLRKPAYSQRWNPLSVPYEFYCKGDFDKACEFANDIAKNLFADIMDKEKFWQNSAASFLFGLILLLFRYCKENQFGEKYVNFSSIFELRNIFFEGNSFQIKNSKIWRYAQDDSIIRNSLIGTVETANETRAGILSTFDQVMRDFSIQPNLLDMLSSNELNIQDFLVKKQALYMIMPDEKTSYHKLVSVFVKQSYEYFIYLAQKNLYEEEIRVGHLPIRINYILDEFSSLPTIADFPAMITAARSRNIRFVLFIQSKHQLKQRYGEETDTIVTNCVNWVFLTTRELSLLEEISKLCGTKEQNPILSVSQLQRLSKEEGEALLLIGRNKPYIAKLPDIDVYDRGKYKGLFFKNKNSSSALCLDFSEFRASFNDPLKAKMDKLSNEEIDKMIAEIDKKIKELEIEEKVKTKKEKLNKNANNE